MLLAEIIGVGTELIYGETFDSNTAEIARSLRGYGLEITRTLRFADELPALSGQLKESLSRCHLIVLSGGLGPTPDDITREAIAEALCEPMEPDPSMVQAIQARFASMGRQMHESNLKQAMKIPSASWLENPRGTAPGWWVHKENLDIVALPGPPAEWRPMWEELLPKLLLPAKNYRQKSFKTYGLGESQIVQVLGGFFRRQGPAEVGTYAKSHGVDVVIRGEPQAVSQLADSIRPLIAANIWGEDADTPQGLLVARLAKAGQTLATAESLSGGMLGSLLTQVPGASQVYLGGMVCYTREAKAFLGVPQGVLEKGMVSPECAQAMAEAAARGLGATYALATTGVAGPEELEGQPVGTVYIGFAGPSLGGAKRFRFPASTRELVRERASYAALTLLLAGLVP